MAGFFDTVLTRRDVMRIGGLTVSGYRMLELIQPLGVRAAAKVSPRGSARFCIFVMLDGGPSHVDGWDLKEGSWTPQDFDVRTLPEGIKWPWSLFPRLTKQLDKVTL